MKKNTELRQIKVTLVMALTADGFTARNSHEYTDWSSTADKKLFSQISNRAKVVIMGKNTYETLNSVLNNRLNIVMGKSENKNHENNLRFFSGEPDILLEELEKEGFKEAVLCGGASTNTLFFKKNLIDEAVFTISPLMFGKGLSVFNCELNAELELKNCQKIDENTVMLHYLFKN
jgi:dihydrofolate reductase